MITTHLFSDLLYEFKDFFCIKYNFRTKFLYEMSFGFLPRKFKENNIIYDFFDDIEEIYLIRKGKIGIFYKNSQDQKIKICELTEYNTIGVFYAFKNWKSEFLYETQNDTETIGILKSHFINVLRKHPKKYKKMLENAISEYKKIQKLIPIVFLKWPMKIYRKIKA